MGQRWGASPTVLMAQLNALFEIDRRSGTSFLIPRQGRQIFLFRFPKKFERSLAIQQRSAPSRARLRFVVGRVFRPTGASLFRFSHGLRRVALLDHRLWGGAAGFMAPTSRKSARRGAPFVLSSQPHAACPSSILAARSVNRARLR